MDGVTETVLEIGELMMTNREYMINLLLDGLEWQDKELERVDIDDGGASYEAMVYYHVNCPYFCNDERALCGNEVGKVARDTCFRCKETWLDSEVDV